MKHGITKRACAPALVLCVGLSIPATARPDAPDPAHAATAQALYDAANADMEAGSFAAAQKKLEEVVRLLPDAPGAKLTLAECHERLGKLASAWAEYAAAEALARRRGQPDRAQIAADRAAVLRSRLATLTIRVSPGAAGLPGLSITRDGAPIGDAQWGTPLPVDAGAHEIAVAAAGHARWTTRVEVVTDGADLALTVPPLAPILVAAPPAPPPAAADRPWQRPLGLGTIGAGGAGVLIGVTAFGLSAARQGASSDGHCGPNGACDDEGAALRRQARGLADFATGALIAGGLIAGVGAVLVLAAPAQDGAGETRKAAVRAAVSPGGLTVGWSF